MVVTTDLHRLVGALRQRRHALVVARLLVWLRRPVLVEGARTAQAVVGPINVGVHGIGLSLIFCVLHLLFSDHFAVRVAGALVLVELYTQLHIRPDGQFLVIEGRYLLLVVVQSMIVSHLKLGILRSLL